MADRKLDDAAATGADYLVAGDAGCLLHLEGRRRRRDAATGPAPTPWPRSAEACLAARRLRSSAR